MGWWRTLLGCCTNNPVKRGPRVLVQQRILNQCTQKMCVCLMMCNDSVLHSLAEIIKIIYIQLHLNWDFLFNSQTVCVCCWVIYVVTHFICVCACVFEAETASGDEVSCWETHTSPKGGRDAMGEATYKVADWFLTLLFFEVCYQ